MPAAPWPRSIGVATGHLPVSHDRSEAMAKGRSSFIYSGTHTAAGLHSRIRASGSHHSGSDAQLEEARAW